MTMTETKAIPVTPYTALRLRRGLARYAAQIESALIASGRDTSRLDDVANTLIIEKPQRLISAVWNPQHADEVKRDIAALMARKNPLIEAKPPTPTPRQRLPGAPRVKPAATKPARKSWWARFVQWSEK